MEKGNRRSRKRLVLFLPLGPAIRGLTDRRDGPMQFFDEIHRSLGAVPHKRQLKHSFRMARQPSADPSKYQLCIIRGA